MPLNALTPSLTVPSTYAKLTNTTAAGASTPGSSAFVADLDYAGQTHLLSQSVTDTATGQTFAEGTPDPNIGAESKR